MAEPRRPVARKKLLIVGVALVAAAVGAAIAILHPGTHSDTTRHAGGGIAVIAVLAAAAASAQRRRHSKEERDG